MKKFVVTFEADTFDHNTNVSTEDVRLSLLGEYIYNERAEAVAEIGYVDVREE
jgi:hypothetical protein